MLKGKRLKRSVLEKTILVLIAVIAVLSLFLVIEKKKNINYLKNPVETTLVDDAHADVELAEMHPVDEILVNDYKKDYLGKFTITWYCGCEECNGENPNVDAHDTPLVEGVVACNDIAQFSHIYIDLGDGLQEFEVRDRMADRYTGKNHIDIYTTDHQKAILNGIAYADVYLKTE